ncbi:MAG TPA: hypothetical protein PLC09_00800, partial [Holophaga sp.]|nr:hypothetical protein [Holophaga sp.]
MDGLLKALLRRVDKEASGTPEWLRLHDLLSQELELLEAEEALPAGVRLTLDLQASLQAIQDRGGEGLAIIGVNSDGYDTAGAEFQSFYLTS